MSRMHLFSRCSNSVSLKTLLLGPFLVILVLSSPNSFSENKKIAPGDHQHHDKHAAHRQRAEKTAVSTSQLSIPDLVLTDEYGREVTLQKDLIQDKIVIMNTIFTTCTTICPVMGVQFSQLQKALQEQHGAKRIEQDVILLSISIDPKNDSAERLRAWKEKFGGAQGWTLLTGSQTTVTQLLKATGLFSATPEDHTPMTLIGRADSQNWTRISGLTETAKITDMVNELLNPATKNKATTSAASASTLSPAAQYFTDVTLINHNGEKKRLYQDLLKGKVVVINSFFSTCQGSCPVIMGKMAQIQQHFNGQMGKALHLLSISLDPNTDTPLKLKSFADELEAGPGWQLLSGKQENVDFALKKLGHYVPDIDSHKNTIIIGNEATGLWKKAFLFAKADDVHAVVESVLSDAGQP